MLLVYSIFGLNSWWICEFLYFIVLFLKKSLNWIWISRFSTESRQIYSIPIQFLSVHIQFEWFLSFFAVFSIRSIRNLRAYTLFQSESMYCIRLRTYYSFVNFFWHWANDNFSWNHAERCSRFVISHCLLSLFNQFFISFFCIFHTTQYTFTHCQNKNMISDKNWWINNFCCSKFVRFDNSNNNNKGGQIQKTRCWKKVINLIILWWYFTTFYMVASI